MKRFFRSEAGAVLLWVAASILLAAAIVPWLYQIGRWLAELAESRAAGGLLGWLGTACQRATFGRYFNRSLLLSALVLLPGLWLRLRRLRRRQPQMPAVCKAAATQRGPLLWVLGLATAGGVVWGMGLALEHLGAFGLNPVQPSLTKLFRTVVVAAVAVSVVEECLFRGLLLGLWLRVSRPAAACIGTSLFFAFVHFLTPPLDYGIGNPASPLAGFQWLGGILRHFTEPGFIAADFLTLLVVGLVLAWARLRTGRLWLSMGLHCGWVIAFKVYNLTHVKLPHGPLGGAWVGDSLRVGLLPLAALGLTAMVCHCALLATRKRAPSAP